MVKGASKNLLLCRSSIVMLFFLLLSTKILGEATIFEEEASKIFEVGNNKGIVRGTKQ